MKKSGDQVISDIYNLIRDSGLMSFVNGKLYKDRTARPLNSSTEDVIISFKAGLDGQLQAGAAIVDIYVPDIDSGVGGMTKNIIRAEQISKKCTELFEYRVLGEYYFTLGNMIQTYQEETIEQHFIRIDLRFKRTTF